MTNAHHGLFDRAKFRPLEEAEFSPGNTYWYDQHDAAVRDITFDLFLTEEHFRHLSNDPTSKILIFYGDEYYNIIELKCWVDTCKKWNIRPEQLYVMCLDHNWVQWTLDALKKLDFEGINIQEYNLLMNRVQPQEDKPIDKRFSVLSRNYSSWRLSLYIQLLKTGSLEEHFNYTFNNINPYQNTVFDLEHIRKDLSDLKITETEQVTQWFTGIPYATKENVLEKLASEVYDLILTSGINLIVESHFDPFWTAHGHRGYDPQVFSPAFPTEKTYKPIACKRPFIAVTTPYFLQEFKNLGYKTFHPYIDETYDTIKDDSQRMQAIVKEVQRLSSLSRDEFLELLENCKEITEHNFKIMEKNKEKFLLTEKFQWVDQYLAKDTVPPPVL